MADVVWVVTRNHRNVAASTQSVDAAKVRAEMILRRYYNGDIRWDQERGREERLMTRSDANRWNWSTYAVEAVPVIDFDQKHEEDAA